MKRRYAFVSGIVVAACLLSGWTASQASAAASRPAVYFDPVGDSGKAPDVSSVAVVNDAAKNVTFAVNLASSPNGLKRGEAIAIGIDVDNNSRTGSGSSGVDSMIELNWFGARRVYGVGLWDGSQFEPVDVAVQIGGAQHGPRFTIASADLGLGKSFRFAIRSVYTTNANSPTPAATDLAPDLMGRMFAYTLGPAEQLGSIEKISIFPFDAFLPQAGKLLEVKKVYVVPGGQSGPLKNGAPAEKLRCSARLESTLLTPAGACAWHVPLTARGKRLMLTISVAYRGDEWTGVYPLKVG